MYKIYAVTALMAVSAIAGCGRTDLERGLTGAGIGALGAVAVGGNPVVGAVAGGAVGATCDEYARSLCR
jgi:hypothetical protein